MLNWSNKTEIYIILNRFHILSVGADSKDILDVLLSQPDCEIFDIDPAGNSLVHAMVETRNVDQLRNILENAKVKAALDSQNSFGATPLAIAVLFNDLNMVRALIESGADPKENGSIKLFVQPGWLEGPAND